MSVVAPGRFAFDHSFVRDLEGLYVPWQAAPVPEPRLLALNEDLAAEVGLDVDWLTSPDGVAVLVGNTVPDGAEPVAMAYAGHQFGGFSPRLGDGRALLVGEFIDAQGRRLDLHLKGSGRTPFARGGDGKAAVGPMLREYVIGEAMHALGIPTTRALAVVSTGETIIRDGVLPGAVLARVASSHVRVGTFQYATRDPELLRRLVDHAISRHHPQAALAIQPVLAFFEAVVEAQAGLIARWMHVGFIHGVMNTDNMTISGETIDYGPCAFMDAYDPATVFSSIDHGGRYAYGNQPGIAAWNLARLGETLLPLIDADSEQAVAAATAVLQTFPDRYHAHWLAGMRAKLGLTTERSGDEELVDALLAALKAGRMDFTSAFRSLASVLRGNTDEWDRLVGASDPALGWIAQWRERLALESVDPATVADAMDAVNPRYVPRNHHVEAALAAATAGDLGPFDLLVEVVSHPFTDRAEWAEFAGPAPAGFGPYQTFCGT